MSNYFPGTDDYDLGARVGELERWKARTENDVALLKDYVDSRFAGGAMPAEPPPPPAAVAVVEQPRVIEPPGIRAENAETWKVIAEGFDLLLQAVASGHVPVERAAELKRRLFDLAATQAEI